MSAYYNEHDGFAAGWLRELIKEGWIADGEVDERDILSITSPMRGVLNCADGTPTCSRKLRSRGMSQHA